MLFVFYFCLFHSHPITRWLDSSYGAWFVAAFFYKDAAPTELKKMRIDILTTQPQPRMFIG